MMEKEKSTLSRKALIKLSKGEKKNRRENNVKEGKEGKVDNEDEISVKVKKEMLDVEVVDLGIHKGQTGEHNNNCQMEVDEVTFDTGKVYTVVNSEEGNDNGKNKRKIIVSGTPVKDTNQCTDKQVVFVTPSKVENPYKPKEKPKNKKTPTLHKYATAASLKPRSSLKNNVRFRFNFNPKQSDYTGNPVQPLGTIMKVIKSADPQALLVPWVKEEVAGPLDKEDIIWRNRVSILDLKKYIDFPSIVKQRGFSQGTSVYKLGVCITTNLSAKVFLDKWNASKKVLTANKDTFCAGSLA